MLQDHDRAVDGARPQELRDPVPILVVGGKQHRLHLAGGQTLGRALENGREEGSPKAVELVEGDDQADRVGLPAAQHARGEVRLVSEVARFAFDRGAHRRIDVRRSGEHAGGGGS